LLIAFVFVLWQFEGMARKPGLAVCAA